MYCNELQQLQDKQGCSINFNWAVLNNAIDNWKFTIYIYNKILSILQFKFSRSKWKKNQSSLLVNRGWTVHVKRLRVNL